MAEPHGDRPDDTMRGRVPGSRIRLWLLLEADRWVVAGVPLALIFVALVVLGALDPVPLREAITASDPVEAEAAFEDLIEALELFGATREHIKTLYFQWALIDLSRAILYASVPALIVAMGAILFLNDPGTVTGATAGVDNVVWVVSRNRRPGAVHDPPLVRAPHRHRGQADARHRPVHPS